MKTTRSIDDYFKVNEVERKGLELYAKLSHEAKQQLLATILASMPSDEEMFRDDTDWIEGWGAHASAVEQAIKKIFESKEGK